MHTLSHEKKQMWRNPKNGNRRQILQMMSGHKVRAEGLVNVLLVISCRKKSKIKDSVENSGKCRILELVFLGKRLSGIKPHSHGEQGGSGQGTPLAYGGAAGDGVGWVSVGGRPSNTRMARHRGMTAIPKHCPLNATKGVLVTDAPVIAFQTARVSVLCVGSVACSNPPPGRWGSGQTSLNCRRKYK